MTISPWLRRIQRAQELAEEHAFAREILGFYIHLARFQEDLQRELGKVLPQAPVPNGGRHELSSAELSVLGSRFESFLALTDTHGPKHSMQTSRELRSRGENLWLALIRETWNGHSRSDVVGFLALAFLQPYAELLRSQARLQAKHTVQSTCPFCNRTAGLGVLRQIGDGGARSLVCSFCLAEWEFRRLVCPGCGEENDRKLPLFNAEQFAYIRVECCETCKTYMKTIDLTKNGFAEPMVDEMAAVPLDLWAQEQGYAKLQRNVLGI